jgi:hypothetical protein
MQIFGERWNVEKRKKTDKLNPSKIRNISTMILIWENKYLQCFFKAISAILISITSELFLQKIIWKCILISFYT